MTDLTDAVQTVVSLLKNSSTGIGSVGYEITDDDATGLTISNGDILVSYTMAKEELLALFGGSQDYDVIFTVKSGEVEDEDIGLSARSWTQPVIIEINVIDKWSTIGSGNKFITASLVRYKAANALRKFIKAKVNAPGGTINVWRGVSYVNEEDTSIKPTLYKCVVTTEAWMYYNPTEDAAECPTGEQASNGDFASGDLSGWVNDGSWYITSGYARTDTEGSVLLQNFNIPVECFVAGSTAEFDWYGRVIDPCAPTYTELDVTLYFDNGYSVSMTTFEGGNKWETDESFLQTILDAVTAGNIATGDKFIQIRFVATTLDNQNIRIDNLEVTAEGS